MAQQDATEPTSAEALFEWGPPRRLTALARLPAPMFPNVGSRTVFVALLGWLPLLLLVAFDPLPVRSGALDSFARDLGTHVRFLVVTPLFVLAFAVCARRLGVVAFHFLTSGLLDEHGRVLFIDAVERARRLINSIWAEVLAVVIAYGIMAALLINGTPAAVLKPWLMSSDGTGYSPAGWWHFLVSVPLLLVLLVGWLWRIVMWTLFLKRIASLDLQLIAAHPDQAGGLGFLAQTVRAFSVVGTALGTMTAIRFAFLHRNGLASSFTDGLLIGGTAILACVLFAGPLLVFTAPMVRAWRRGTMTYGALATSLGIQFERSWFVTSAQRDATMLEKPDFSATTDLYQVVSNVYAMRFVPIDLRSMVILMVFTLVPFIPAMFLSMPIDVVMEELKGLLF